MVRSASGVALETVGGRGSVEKTPGVAEVERERGFLVLGGTAVMK